MNTSNKHSYLLIVLTAVLTGIVSTAGTYFTTQYQSEQVIKQKKYDNQNIAYENFLSAITSVKNQNLLYIIAIGIMNKSVSTDTSIQSIEDTMYELSKEENKTLYSLIRQCQDISLYGSQKVQLYCSDMLSVLLNNHYSVDWDQHTSVVNSVRSLWIDNEGLAYGWEPKVTDEERLKFFVLSAQYIELVEQLKFELNNPNY